MIRSSRFITPKQLRKRYIFALSMIALLITVSQLSLQLLIAAQESDSDLINLAGRQRMLSQKIAKSSVNLVQATGSKTKESHRLELREAARLWVKTQQGLQYGDESLGLPGHNSEQIQALFDSIQPAYEAILVDVNLLLEPDISHAESIAALLNIQINEAKFLKSMNEIVFLYAEEAANKVKRIQLFEVFLFVATLLVLVIEVFYIFSPAARRVEQTLNSLKKRYRDLEKLFSATPTGMLLVDARDLSIVVGNQRMLKHLGLDPKRPGRHKLDAFLPQAHQANQTFLERLRLDEQIEEVEIVLDNPLGQTLEMLASVRQADIRGRDVYIIGFTDVTDIKRAQKIIEHHATIDAMTQLINRRTGLLMLEKAFANAQRYHSPLTICYLDLDGLKQANDRYGHAEGDWLIKTFSKIVAESVREADIAARLGGDEFLLVLPQSSDKESLELMQRLKQKLHKIEQDLCKAYSLSFSYGVVQLDSTRHNNAQMLLAEADKQMYLQKHAKREQDPLSPEQDPCSD
ncbi:diguanylate cyclase [Motiliproteus coralliicola]|uniref:diguanylate cyclase n=1 Tax=Motiliproteus coralliicola TaxID=2283196 RepID=A0A369WVJ5_9GAMM|nr:diguanylate cyclase [Motiliproteus coralliicola]RDE24566.1 diguanylate cyclase [Motiliproteus coralliicola]